MTKADGNNNRSAYGAINGVLAYTLWGLLPIYWKHINGVPAYEILAHRIVWSFLFVTSIVLFKGKWDKLKTALKNRDTMKNIVICALLISVNWFIYIWSVNANHIVDASMGYYINPFVSVLLGMAVLGERLQKAQYAALAIACAGVLVKIIVFGEIPWISLALALSFGFYGLYKKRVTVDSSIGLSIETLVVAPVALAFLIFVGANGNGSFLSSRDITLLLALTGVATATPLLLFAEAAKNVQLTTIGFLQYISPSISLLLGIFVYKEGFTHADLVSFGMIWTALVIYSVSLISTRRRS